MRLDIITLFPEMIEQALGHSICRRAQEAGLVEIRTANPRDFAQDARKTVDDKPFGGGPGMLMMAEPLAQALESLGPLDGAAVIVTDPTGPLYGQNTARELAQNERVVIVCGHYEGIDERFIEEFATHRVSIGDYILTGGELPALVIADSLIRLIPGVLGDEASLEIDAFSDGLLSAPQYTRPEAWRGRAAPDAYRSGDHAELHRTKRAWALRATRERRPDLFALAPLEKRDLDML
jgi:tRNA (guanine37-N1)-methyltransferase